MKEENPYAFPTSNDNYYNGNHQEPGMTLRDYFAAKALEGYVNRRGSPDLNFEYAAKTAYQYPDAMLKERTKTK